jgi:hypothetical protein
MDRKSADILPESATTIMRCCMRLLGASSVAVIFTDGSFAASMATTFLGVGFWCIAGAAWRREPLFGPSLNRWDEAFVFLMVARFVHKLV